MSNISAPPNRIRTQWSAKTYCRSTTSTLDAACSKTVSSRAGSDASIVDARTAAASITRLRPSALVTAAGSPGRRLRDVRPAAIVHLVHGIEQDDVLHVGVLLERRCSERAALA